MKYIASGKKKIIIMNVIVSVFVCVRISPCPWIESSPPLHGNVCLVRPKKQQRPLNARPQFFPSFVTHYFTSFQSVPPLPTFFVTVGKVDPRVRVCDACVCVVRACVWCVRASDIVLTQNYQTQVKSNIEQNSSCFGYLTEPRITFKKWFSI